MLIACLFALANSAQRSVDRALGKGSVAKQTASASSSPRLGETPVAPGSSASSDADEASSHSLHEVDLLLPKVCEALILAVQCLISLILPSEDDGKTVEETLKGREGHFLPTPAVSYGAESLRAFVGAALSPAGLGLVEELIGEDFTLSDLDLLI